eukprot:CAMPEP_0196662352 /NCGR_PEP_ID=MMETSP1086-20130531/48282_1 /TAXON_ID=77921 /ORGANISM="Cyanoptyche  gloeocystis , Strain SAG4.97" /LENGTH=274 /DNA_ID=CAMNT_0041997683 /DNA_START=460 /DNA_END=1282 /DNA_ORIENTATION=+
MLPITAGQRSDMCFHTAAQPTFDQLFMSSGALIGVVDEEGFQCCDWTRSRCRSGGWGVKCSEQAHHLLINKATSGVAHAAVCENLTVNLGTRAWIVSRAWQGWAGARLASEGVGGEDELVCDPRLERRVPCIGDDAEVRFGEGAVQLPRGGGWTDEVVAAVDDICRDVADLVNTVEQLRVPLEEAVVDKVVALDARQRDAEGVGGEAEDSGWIDVEAAGAALPYAPRARCTQPLLFVVAGNQPPMVSVYDGGVALVGGDGLHVVVEGIGEHGRG